MNRSHAGRIDESSQRSTCCRPRFARVEIDKRRQDRVITGKPNGETDSKEGENEWEHG